MIQKPKGTYDLINTESRKWLYVEEIIKNIAKVYNYEFIKTPMFERSELFHRGIGETTDIISKETYDFSDKSNRNMTLKPEGTAGAVRAFIENKMYAENVNPVKMFYFSPCFRYERPQAGRFREHTQFGVETFGIKNPSLDAEIISIPILLYQMLGIDNLKVKINSLGDSTARENYKNALKVFLKDDINNFCEDCKVRYEKNPLRILDCKVDQAKLKDIPKLYDYLSNESKEYFNEVTNALKELNINFEIDYNLVRGFDYYTDTIFEIHSEKLGNSIALGGGGRYDKLVESLNGPKTPAMGFGIGLERLLMLLEDEKFKKNLDVFIYSFNKGPEALKVANLLRQNGYSSDIEYENKKLTSSFKKADKLGSKIILIIGEEFKENKVTIKFNNQAKEEKIEIDKLIDYLDNNLD